MFSSIMAVSLGGALGAAMRFVLLAFSPIPGPWGLLIVNLLGAFFLGLVIPLMFHFELDADQLQLVKAFVIVGILGGFTTFSGIVGLLFEAPFQFKFTIHFLHSILHFSLGWLVAILGFKISSNIVK